MRNEELLLQQRRTAMRAFQGAFQRGEAVVRDRFGNAVVSGALVLYKPPVDMVFRVVSAVPVLDPRQPPGLVTLTVQVEAPVTVRVGVPTANVIVVQGVGADGTPGPPEETPVAVPLTPTGESSDPPAFGMDEPEP